MVTQGTELQQSEATPVSTFSLTAVFLLASS